ncbi:unnamed protein product [Trichogramma brassicae]|uniref:Uncharacterized protein n=1 Tax=Trichogramma brassicae TaxID=86971 RepID=A0A6H5I4G8_9HYME|nr:unnamed protein product [Trichogramma brassicae]
MKASTSALCHYTRNNHKEEEEREQKKRKPGVGALFTRARRTTVCARGRRRGSKTKRHRTRTLCTVVCYFCCCRRRCCAHILDRVEVSASEIDKSVLGAVYPACACVFTEISTYFGTPCKREIKNIARRLPSDELWRNERASGEREKKKKRLVCHARPFSRFLLIYTICYCTHSSSRSTPFLEQIERLFTEREPNESRAPSRARSFIYFFVLSTVPIRSTRRLNQK